MKSTNRVGEHFIRSSITEVDGKFIARYAVGTRSDTRLCDTRDEAELFVKNGIREENGFCPLGIRGGLER